MSQETQHKFKSNFGGNNFSDFQINKKKLVPIQKEDTKSYHKHCKKPLKEFKKYTSEFQIQRDKQKALLQTRKKNTSQLKRDYYNDKKEYYVEVMKKIETKSQSSVSRSPQQCRSRSRSYRRSFTDTRNCVICHKQLQINF